MLTKGAIMNLKRWWCAITTHKWRRERHEGVDQLHCRRCGFVTNVQDESRQERLQRVTAAMGVDQQSRASRPPMPRSASTAPASLRRLDAAQVRSEGCV